MLNIQNTLLQLINEADHCIAKRHLTAFLILIYAGIDAVSALETGTASPDTFKKWVQRYLLRAQWSPCTADDLYAARCGMVHTFSAESEKSRSGQAKWIWYTFGNQEPSTLKGAAGAIKTPVAVETIKVEEFLSAFCRGLADYFDEIETDPVRRERVIRNGKRWMSVVHAPDRRE